MTTPASRRPCSMVSAARARAGVGAPGAPGDSGTLGEYHPPPHLRTSGNCPALHFGLAGSTASPTVSHYPRLSTVAQSHPHLGVLSTPPQWRLQTPAFDPQPQRCYPRASPRWQPATGSQQSVASSHRLSLVSVALCQHRALAAVPRLLAALSYSQAVWVRRVAELLLLRTS